MRGSLTLCKTLMTGGQRFVKPAPAASRTCRQWGRNGSGPLRLGPHFKLTLTSNIRVSSIWDIFSLKPLKMAKNKGSAGGKQAKGKAKGKGDAGDREEKEESAREHKWNDLQDEIKVRHILWLVLQISLAVCGIDLLPQ